ncbi:hypothetical protein [Leptolyngbya sp. FACHB-17]|nr:hypothetical protein [Leptolyngbya sp. FACHB-17]
MSISAWFPLLLMLELVVWGILLERHNDEVQRQVRRILMQCRRN